MVEILQDGDHKEIKWEVREPSMNGTKHDGKRYYKTTATVYYADCKEKGCTFQLEGRNALAVGSIHHDKYGHPVDILAVRSIHYGG